MPGSLSRRSVPRMGSNGSTSKPGKSKTGTLALASTRLASLAIAAPARVPRLCRRPQARSFKVSPDLSCGHPMNPTRRNYAPAGYCRVLERPRNPPDDHAQAGVTFHQSDTRAIVDYRPLASHPRSRVKSQGIQLTPPDAQGRRVSARRTSSAGSGEIRASRVKWPSRRPHLVK